MKLVVLDGYTLNPGDNPWEPLAALGELVVYDRSSREEVVERGKDATILITNKVRLDEELFRQLPKLRCIGVVATGYDVVDIAAAGERGIPVINVVAYGVESVAQHVFALLLELCRHTALHDASIRQGEWAANADWCYWLTPQVDLYGKTMGLLGFGNIGRRVGELAHAFGMQVLVSARHEPPLTNYPFTFMEREELLARADILSLHCPLTEETRHIINAERLAHMRDGAILINTARGPLLDEAAVAAALSSGKLGGLGADVLSEEPVTPDNPLLSAPNTLLTPHIAWASLAARQNIIRIMAENLAAWMQGTPKSVVNSAHLKKARTHE